MFDDPTELIEKRLDFYIQIDGAELDENFWQKTFCEYSFLTEDGSFKTFKTITVRKEVTEITDFKEYIALYFELY